jgi:hypothetical protein
MRLREFLQGCDPILRQIEASSRATGWIPFLDVEEDARAGSVYRIGRVINDQATAETCYRSHVLRAN